MCGRVPRLVDAPPPFHPSSSKSSSSRSTDRVKNCLRIHCQRISFSQVFYPLPLEQPRSSTTPGFQRAFHVRICQACLFQVLQLSDPTAPSLRPLSRRRDMVRLQWAHAPQPLHPAAKVPCTSEFQPQHGTRNFSKLPRRP